MNPRQLHAGGGICCAMGHCQSGSVGERSEEQEALVRLFEPEAASYGFACRVARINDREDMDYQQATPKARILAALRDLPATPEQTGLGKEER